MDPEALLHRLRDGVFTGSRCSAFAEATMSSFTLPSPELINLQDDGGQAKPYQLRQLLRLVERYHLLVGRKP